MKKFLQVCGKIRPFYSAVYKVVMLLCKLMLIADILVTSWVVLQRFVPSIPPANWGEEVILTLMVYMAVLSASLAIRRNAHIRMTLFDNKLPKKAIPYLDLFSDILVLILAFIMAFEGLKLANKIPGFFIALTWLPKFWQYFPISLAGFAMIFFEIERIYVDLCHMNGDYSVDEEIKEETTVDISKYATKKKEAK